KKFAGFAGEIKNNVETFCRCLQELGQSHRMRQQSAIGANNVERRTCHSVRVTAAVSLNQSHVQPAGVAGIEHAETIPPRLYVQMRPHFAVYQHGVAEELWNPELVGAAISHWIEQASVRIKETILDH